MINIDKIINEFENEYNKIYSKNIFKVLDLAILEVDNHFTKYYFYHLLKYAENEIDNFLNDIEKFIKYHSKCLSFTDKNDKYSYYTTLSAHTFYMQDEYNFECTDGLFDGYKYITDDMINVILKAFPSNTFYTKENLCNINILHNETERIYIELRRR